MSSRTQQRLASGVMAAATERRSAAAPSHAASVERAEVYLQPGQLVAAAAPTAIKTILGSCVAVCLWDEQIRVGGMNHYLLPYGSAKAEAGDRFGNSAIPRLIESVTALGAKRATLCAKVFGGAAIVGGSGRNVTRIGQKNVQIALELLDLAGIPIVGRDLGGERGRKIVFHTDTGAVALWEL